jgi:hypothetical protein
MAGGLAIGPCCGCTGCGGDCGPCEPPHSTLHLAADYDSVSFLGPLPGPRKSLAADLAFIRPTSGAPCYWTTGQGAFATDFGVATTAFETGASMNAPLRSATLRCSGGGLVLELEHYGRRNGVFGFEFIEVSYTVRYRAIVDSCSPLALRFAAQPIAADGYYWRSTRAKVPITLTSANLWHSLGTGSSEYPASLSGMHPPAGWINPGITA